MTIEQLPRNREFAIFLAKKQRAELIADAANLEGCNFTIPEINTLLGGVTVGGHALEDEKIALNQVQAWRQLFHDLDHNLFELTPEYMCKLQGLVAKEEALSWGVFRTSQVYIAGTEYEPPNSIHIPFLINEMIGELNQIESPVEKGITCFLKMARIQPFFDGNKRTGRLMMNGIFLDAGCPAISIAKKDELEFNTLMTDFYESNEMRPMADFIRRSLNPKIERIFKEELPRTASEQAFGPGV